MPTMPNDPCSDLAAARAASRALRGLAAATTPTRGYTSFAPERRRATHDAAPERFGVGDWDRLLVDARALLRASSAFVVGDEGLVIDHAGAIDATEAEGVGSRAQLALDLFDSLDPGATRPRFVVGSLGDAHLVVVRFALGDETRVTLGLRVDEAPDARARAALEDLVVSVARRRRLAP